jgi:hypothetical protein
VTISLYALARRKLAIGAVTCPRHDGQPPVGAPGVVDDLAQGE